MHMWKQQMSQSNRGRVGPVDAAAASIAAPASPDEKRTDTTATPRRTLLRMKETTGNCDSTSLKQNRLQCKAIAYYGNRYIPTRPAGLLMKDSSSSCWPWQRAGMRRVQQHGWLHSTHPISYPSSHPHCLRSQQPYLPLSS